MRRSRRWPAANRPRLLNCPHYSLAQFDALHDVNEEEACEERVEDGEDREDDAVEVEEGSGEHVLDLVEQQTLTHLAFLLQLLIVLGLVETHEEGRLPDEDVNEKQAPAAQVDH